MTITKTKIKTMTKTQIHTKTKYFRHAMYAIFFLKAEAQKILNMAFPSKFSTKTCALKIAHQTFSTNCSQKCFPQQYSTNIFWPNLSTDICLTCISLREGFRRRKKRKKSGLLPNPPSDPPTPVWSFLREFFLPIILFWENEMSDCFLAICWLSARFLRTRRVGGRTSFCQLQVNHK